jgi:hypothetical protein
MAESSDTRDATSAPGPSPEIQRLGALVGRWRSEGHIVGEVPVPITGTDIGMTARWERSDDGARWQPWMDMTFTRMP